MGDKEKPIELMLKIYEKCNLVEDCELECEYYEDYPKCQYEKILDHLIANNVVVRETGYLIFHEDEYGTVAECSCCHVQGMLYGNFCVHCGADMRGAK